jgi:hypothetical protein
VERDQSAAGDDASAFELAIECEDAKEMAAILNALGLSLMRYNCANQLVVVKKSGAWST